jgi:hypothetical protein
MFNTTNIFYCIGFIIIVILCLKIYKDSDYFNLKCIISSKDGNRYCVRERNKMELAANLLAEVTDRCKILIIKLKEKLPDDERIKRLHKNFNPKKISETLPTSELTAYSENKGEKIAFCLNTTKNGNKLIDKETLFFVACHELAHISTISIGHKQEFWDNFKFILLEAEKLGLYNPVDYKKEPKSYCGLEINDNPYYDL